MADPDQPSAMDSSEPNSDPRIATPIPSDWDHARTLVALSFRKDRKKPKLWALKFILMPALLMLYTIGFFLGYEGNDDDTIVAGDYRLFQGQEWAYPAKIKMGASDPILLEKVADFLAVEFDVENSSKDGKSTSSMELQVSNATSSTELVAECQGQIDEQAANEICVYLQSDVGYELYFGGKGSASPSQPALAGAQYSINSALMNISGINELYPVIQIQQTPQLLTKESVQPDMAAVLVPSCMYVLSALVCSLFLVGPVVYEKINGIAKSYLLVGVKMKTYLLQWLLYYALNGTLLALLMTLVCIFFNLMPLSNFGLVFLSNYLGLVQMFSMLIIGMQFVNAEEMSSPIIWINGLFSIVIGVAFIVLSSPDSVGMTIFSVFSPYIGMMQYIGIYITYDVTGFNSGIHPGPDVVESGLLGNIIAQICGIIFWVCMMLVYSSATVRAWASGTLGKNHANCFTDLGAEDRDKFEPVLPGKDVVLSLLGVCHTYHPSKLFCNKESKPVEVLKGLSLDICRGEVFGYLGHNGSGKSTSIEILSGELGLQSGHATYHLKGGDARLGDPFGDEVIRKKIGVCPQHNDSLQPDLTCRETLMLFAQLKGNIAIEEGQTTDQAVSDEVDRRLSEVKFTADGDCDKPVGTFSGGMKRKLLIAIALLGDPEVIFLDEPTAGLDPYNRRIIWDVIISAKKGRSIVLTTHFLDEADVLSDRIGIIKNGHLITCGSSLFLKHNFGAGYSLRYKSNDSFRVSSVVPTAEMISKDSDDEHQWRLNFGTEPQIPRILSALQTSGATNISLEITTLEEVFIKTGEEDLEVSCETQEGTVPLEHEDAVEHGISKEEEQARIWEQRAPHISLSPSKKFRLVQHFITTNSMKVKGAIFLNLAMPLVYLVVGLVTVSLIELPSEGEIVVSRPITVSSPWLACRFFGVESLENQTIHPLKPVPEPIVLDDYFGNGFPMIGGYYSGNKTLQFAPDVDVFALQFGAAVMANYSYFYSDGDARNSSTVKGITSSVQQLPYTTSEPFRFDVLFLPMALSFGFAGLAFVVLDVLLLKGDNIISLFRVGGITEWMTFLGVFSYKFYFTFAPFFTLTLVLGFSLKSVIVGNGGRWLGTILVMFGYAYSGTPVGLIFAKRYVHGNYKEVANWLPGVYFTFVSLPYLAFSSALQATSSSVQNTILIIGDVLCIIPQFAFQYGIGSVIRISPEFNDADLSWRDVWAFEARVWYTILVMFLVGSLEWYCLYRLTTTREQTTKLSKEELIQYAPVDVSQNPDLSEERERSRMNNEGINARDLVKVFLIKENKSRWKSKEKVIKQAVKGVSFGIRKNEIYSLLGPNGAGKSTAMNVLASQITPEHGEICLDGETAFEGRKNVDHLYSRCNVAFCPQFDALFPKKTVEEHIRFYADIRGIDRNNRTIQEHLNAIVKLLGLEKHRHKQSTELSGGYKRRLCLCIAMIGFPKVMMVDECTTGLDPSARRLVWDVLKPEVRNGYDVPAILLSSHYMDECQHLGSRIGIMIDGELVATGSLDRLQELYCTGLFVDIALQSAVADCNKAESDTIQAFSESQFDASVYESIPYHFKLKVMFRESAAAHNNVSLLADVFELLESRKENLCIKFYSVALMNLEQIFIDLSRKQFEADENFGSKRELSTR